MSLEALTRAKPGTLIGSVTARWVPACSKSKYVQNYVKGKWGPGKVEKNTCVLIKRVNKKCRLPHRVRKQQAVPEVLDFSSHDAVIEVGDVDLLTGKGQTSRGG